jgi:hypothetical protein
VFILQINPEPGAEGIGFSLYLRLEWELLCPGSNRALEIGRFRQHGARGTRALQHAGGDRGVWGGIGEDAGSEG